MFGAISRLNSLHDVKIFNTAGGLLSLRQILQSCTLGLSSEGEKGSYFLPRGPVVHLNPRPLVQGSEVETLPDLCRCMALYANEVTTHVN